MAFTLLLSGWLALAAHPAHAQTFAPGSVCHLAAALDDDVAQISLTPSRWTCGARNWQLAAARTIIRFDVRAGTTPPPLLITRLTRFAQMRITVTGTDGHSISRAVTMADMAPGTADWVMSTPIPHLSGPVRAVFVAIDNPRHTGMLADAHLADAADAAGGTLTFEFGIAALCGMLCMPLVFNLGFYRVLRQRFLLWHTMAVLFMLAQTLVTSGLINRFVALPLPVLCMVSALTWAFGIVAACLFSADLIETDKLDRLHRMLLRSTVVWIPAWTMVYLFADGPWRPWAPPLYFASFVPLIGLFVWVMIVAWLRGSRAVRFQVAAMLPLLMTGAVRVASSLGLTPALMELQFEQHLSIALEVIITSLGVADRFLVIRRERDQAQLSALRHEFQAVHDPLTGLLNRRGLEEQFAGLQARGFRAMAIVDLDHFKLVNDTHGHAVGDNVLRAVAVALGSDAQTLAVRWGGEEFLLLLAGADIADRAERRRMAIPLRVAAALPGLDRVVTASMGLVEQDPGGDAALSFLDMYERCDRLLYAAKSAGRNRTVVAGVAEDAQKAVA